MMKKLFFVSLCAVICFLIPADMQANSIMNKGTYRLTARRDAGLSLSLNIRDIDILCAYHTAPGDTLLLPMTLLDFNVYMSGINCYLVWKAVREEYSPAYSIERSIDGKTYSEIGTTKGKGKEIGMQQFTFTDYGAANLGVRIVFYRLRQLNAEGKSEYTHVIAVTVNNRGSFAEVFPNPVINEANLLVHVLKEERLGWNLTDQSGRRLKSGHSQVSPWASRFTIDVNGLPPGIYFLQLQSGSFNNQLKLLKL